MTPSQPASDIASCSTISACLPDHSSASFEDGLSGEIKGVPFQMTEAHLTKRTGTGKSKKTVTVFRGLLLSFPVRTPGGWTRGAVLEGCRGAAR